VIAVTLTCDHCGAHETFFPVNGHSLVQGRHGWWTRPYYPSLPEDRQLDFCPDCVPHRVDNKLGAIRARLVGQP
jgi:hypothetical protein